MGAALSVVPDEGGGPTRRASDPVCARYAPTEKLERPSREAAPRLNCYVGLWTGGRGRVEGRDARFGLVPARGWW